MVKVLTYILNSPPDESRHLTTEFMKAWQKELDFCGPENANIWRAAFYAYGSKFMLGGAAFLLESGLQIGEALLLGRLLIYFQTPGASSKDGYLAAMGLSLCVIAHGVMHHIEFFLTMRAGMLTRSFPKVRKSFRMVCDVSLLSLCHRHAD